MYYCFSSDYPSALKVNGGYLGGLYGTVKFFRAEKKEPPPLIEILPLNEGFFSVCFLLDDAFLTSPPKNFSVTDLKGGYLIKPLPKIVGQEFKLLKQLSSGGTTANLFYSGNLNFSIETQTLFFSEGIDLPFIINPENHTVILEETPLSNGRFITLKIGNGDDCFCRAYYVGKEIKNVFCGIGDFFAEDGFFKSVEIIKDIAKHRKETTWDFDTEEEKLVLKKHAVTSKEGFSVKNLPEKILPFAFFEEIVAGGDLTPFLDGDMLKNADKLRNFLGDFIGVFPPPDFLNTDGVGIIKKKKENLFFAEYFSVKTEDGKITDIFGT